MDSFYDGDLKDIWDSDLDPVSEMSKALSAFLYFIIRYDKQTILNKSQIYIQTYVYTYMYMYVLLQLFT